MSIWIQRRPFLWPYLSTRLWYTIQAAAQLYFTLLNRPYVSRNVEEYSSLSLNGPHKVVIDGWLLNLHWPVKHTRNSYTKPTVSSRGKPVVDSGCKETIGLVNVFDKACQGFFAWFFCLLSSPNKGKSASAIALSMPSIGITVIL